jgi:hypothetical protein
MKTFVLILALSFLPVSMVLSQSDESKFLDTYIDVIGNLSQLETQASKDIDQAGNKSTKKFLAIMKNAKRSKLELRSSIEMLRPFISSKNQATEGAADIAINCFDLLIRNADAMVEISKKMISAGTESNSNINLGEISSSVTDITSKHEYIMQTLLDASPMFAYSILDTIPDDKGIVSYLLLTSKERKNLIAKIDSHFGDAAKILAPGKKKSTYLAIAYLLRSELTGKRKSRDDRSR